MDAKLNFGEHSQRQGHLGGADEEKDQNQFIQGCDKAEDPRGDDSRSNQGQGDVYKGFKGTGSQIAGGPQQVFVHAFEHAEHRQDHERQHDVHHAHQHCEFVVEQRQGFVDQSDGEQKFIDDTLGLKQNDPGVGTHQDAGEKGQQDTDHQQIAGALTF